MFTFCAGQNNPDTNATKNSKNIKKYVLLHMKVELISSCLYEKILRDELRLEIFKDKRFANFEREIS
jgi:hypothetical protein